MSADKIVALGLLSTRDLERLGDTFSRAIPVTDDDIFAHLLAKLDHVNVEPLGKGVTLMPEKPIPRQGE
jgi:hypothetical protein